MIQYDHWRQRYVRQYKEGLYVAYNDEGHLKPKDSVTVSEASGYVPAYAAALIRQVLCL